MAESEVGTEHSNIVEVEVEDPRMDAVAREAAKVNAMADVNRGLNPFQALGPNEDPVMKFTNDLRSRRLGDILDYREKAVEGEGDISSSDASVAKYKDDLQGANGLLGPYRQKALEMISDGQVARPDTDVDELAYAMMYNMELSQEFADIGFGETVADVAGTLIPLRETYNLVELGRALGFVDGIKETAAATANPGGLMETMRAMALSLKPEDRVKMFEDTVAHLESLDNNVIKQSILQGVFKGSYDPDLMNFWNTLDIADTATAIGSVAKLATGLAKSGSMVNMLKKKPTVESYDLLTRASGTEIGEVAGVRPADMADVHDPLLRGPVAVELTGAPDNVAAEVTQMIETQNARIRELQAARIREGVLTRERENEVMTEAEEQIRRQDNPFNMKTERTSTGFKVTYDRAKYDPDTDSFEVVEEGVTKDFHLDNQGTWDIDVDTEYFDRWWRMDPNSRFRNTLNNDLVQSAQTITREQSKIINTLENTLKDAYKPLNRKEAAKLDRILLQGSKESKEYSYTDLKAMGASDKVAKAYFGQRNVTKQLYELENQKIVDQMVALDVKLVETPEGMVAGRTWDDPLVARRAYLNDDPDSFSVLVLGDGYPGASSGQRLQFETAGQFSREAVEEAYRRGFVLTRNYHKRGYFKNGDVKTEWALVKADTVHSPHGQRVINQVPGYVPKARKNSFFFIKKRRDTDVTDGRVKPDGSRRQDEATVAWADSYEAAKKYAARLGGEDGGYTVRFDREMDAQALQDDMLLVRGGLFGGKRKEQELLYVGENPNVEFESSLEMMERYINHLGRQLPSHLWRLGTEQRIVEKAKEFMPGARLNNINDVMPQAQEFLGKSSKKYNLLRDMVDQVQTVTGIPTEAEKEMAKKFERIGKTFEGSAALKPFAKLFYKASQRNLSIGDQIRGVTFLHMLGMYNPAQFIVQASGMLTAFAVNPVSFGKAAPKMIGWQMLDGFAKDPQAQKRAADWLRSKGLGDYADSYQIWSKSGFRESVVSANSDMATLFGNKPYNAGVLQRALANNRIFYEMGELTMSRASVATAVEWYKGVNKVSKIDLNDDAALKAIFNRAEQYRLNMGRANQSTLNKGWKAVPFQFQQVISKYYEKIFTDELTRAERVRLFAIPTAMMGAVTVPGANFVAEGVASMAGIDLSQLSPDQVALFEAGSVGWMLSEALDVNVDFSSRMSLGTDLWNNMLEFASGGGGNLLATVMGPSGHVATRYSQAGQYLWKSLDTVGEMEEFTSDEVILMSKVVADALASLPSGSRNLTTYLPHLLGNEDAFMRDGRFMWEWEDMNKQTAVMAALGFQPEEMNDLYKLSNELRGVDRPTRLKFLNTDADVLSHIISTGMMGADKDHELDLYRKVVQAAVKSYDPADRSELVRKVWENLNKPRYSADDLFHKFRIHNLTHIEDGLNFINKLVSQKMEAWEARNQETEE